MKKVLIMLANGFETIEALAVKDVCARAGILCDLCTISDETVVESSHGVKVVCDITLNDDTLSYDALVIPGGMPGAKNLRDNDRILEIIRDYHTKEKIVASICAGPIALSKAGILEGKNVTSYPGYESELGNVCYKDDVVVIDRNIITSRGPATALEFAYIIITKLGYEEKAIEIRKGMLVNYYLDK